MNDHVLHLRAVVEKWRKNARDAQEYLAAPGGSTTVVIAKMMGEIYTIFADEVEPFLLALEAQCEAAVGEEESR